MHRKQGSMQAGIGTNNKRESQSVNEFSRISGFAESYYYYFGSLQREKLYVVSSEREPAKYYKTTSTHSVLFQVLHYFLKE